MTLDIRAIQMRLTELGFDPGPIDGIRGPMTDAAIVAFKASKGLRARAYVGPVTLSALFGGKPEDHADEVISDDPPWLNELAKHIGWHEVRDNAKLRAWLASDGHALGDPKKYPWCGDAMETAIKLTLPKEPFPGALGQNPYWARNWVLFGKHIEPCVGAVTPFERPGGGGHIAALIGIDKAGTHYRVRGGNQTNAITDTWIEARRALDTRWPVTYDGPRRRLPIMNSAGAIISTNEA